MSLLLLVAMSTGAGCQARRSELNREALIRFVSEAGSTKTDAPPSLTALWALRIPSPPSPPVTDPAVLSATTDALARAQMAIAWFGDVDAAEEAWAEQVPTASEALLRHECLVRVALHDVAGAEASCLRYVEQFPDQMHAPALLMALRSLGRLRAGGFAGAISSRAQRWLQACAVNGRYCPELAWVVQAAQLEEAERNKDVAKATAAVTRAGRLTTAHIFGPFAGDEVGSFVAEADAEPLSKRPLRFASTFLESWNGEFSPGRRNEAGFYRLRFGVKLAAAAKVRMLLRCSGACRLRVDSKVMAERHPLLYPGPEVLRTAMRWSAGSHDLEVLAWIESGVDVISLSVLDERGRPVAVASAAQQGRSSLISSPPLPSVSGPPRGGNQRGGDRGIDANALQELDDELAASWWGSGGFLADAERKSGLFNLVTRYGDSPVVVAHAAQAFAQLEEGTAASSLRALWDAVITRWPDHPQAWIERVLAEVDAAPGEALVELNRLLERWPNHLPAHRLRATLAIRQGAFDDAWQSAQRLSAPSTANEEDLTRALQVAEAKHDPLWRAQLAQRLAISAAHLYSAEKAEWLLQGGQTTAGLDELRRVCDAEPGHLASERLWGLLEIVAPIEAKTRLADHVQRFPNDRSAWRRRAEVAAALDGEEAGRLLVQQGLERFGGDAELWALAEELGAPLPFAGRFAEADAAIAEWSGLAARPLRDHPVVFVLDDVERHLFEDQSQMVLRHFVVELTTEDAVDAYGEFQLGFEEQLRRLRVLKADGSMIEPEIVSGVDDLTLPGLAVGDLVELLTTNFISSPVLDGFAFDLQPLESAAPAWRRRYTLVAPTAWLNSGLTLLATPGAPPATRVRTGSRERVTYRLDEVAARWEESDAAPGAVSVVHVGFSRGVDAEAWARIRGGPVMRTSRVTPWLKRVARQIASASSDEEKLWQIWRFVLTRIGRAETPSVAEQVLQTGRGDRLALLLALLRAADLEVTPLALFLPQLENPLALPSPQHFARRGARVEHEHGTTYFFGDGSFGVPGALPVQAKDAQVLDLALERPPPAGILGIFGASASRLQDLPAQMVAEDAPVQMLVDLVATEHQLTGFVALRVPKHLAEPLRSALLAADDTQRRAAFEQLLGGALPGVRVTQVDSPSLARHGENLGLGLSLVVPLRSQPGQPTRFDRLFADGATTPLGLFPGLARLLRVADRQRPLDVPAGAEILELQLSLPVGSTFIVVPEPASLTAGPVVLETSSEVNERKLYLRRSLEMKGERLSPAKWRRLRPALIALANAAQPRLSFLMAKPVSKSEPKSVSRSEPKAVPSQEE